ncbi:MAG TPA: NADH-quinone oxidoreductase subunit F, partial [Desulfitobacterium dehalogenans]|nr:NADH-quinone oxidoreductase subunit F [Desulfitobacterium dehalogenans]
MNTEAKKQVFICAGTGCLSSGANKIIDLMNVEIKRQGLSKNVELIATGCRGFCEQGPTLVVEPAQRFYRRIQPEDIPELVEKELGQGEKVERLFYVDPLSGEPALSYEDISFFAKQTRIALKNCGFIDPTKLEDYLAHGGYEGL